MKLGKLSGVEEVIQRAIRLGLCFSCCGLAGMMLVLVVDVCLRSALALPLPGTIEVVQLLMVLVGFFALAYTASEKGHVTIGLVASRLPGRIQAILDSFASLLGVLVLAAIGWQLGLRGWDNIFAINPMHTPRLLIPYAPFLFMAALGSIFLCLHLLVSLFYSLTQVARK